MCSSPPLADSVWPADISKPGDLDALFPEVQSQLGGLDVLVNNPGLAGAPAAVADYPNGQ